jgi:hypothetical protein
LLCEDIFSGCTACSTTLPVSCQTCPASYFESSTGECTQCVGNCTICSNTASCSTCNSGYFYSGTQNKCLLCEDIFSGCTACSTTLPVSCQTCQTSYFVNSTSGCTQCVGNCTICSNTASCSTCNSGHFYSGTQNKCLLCEDIFSRCTACSTTLPVSCQTCPTSYFVNSTRGCSPCVGNCTVCSNSSSCTTCNSGHFYSSTHNRCLLC